MREVSTTTTRMTSFKFRLVSYWCNMMWMWRHSRFSSCASSSAIISLMVYRTCLFTLRVYYFSCYVSVTTLDRFVCPLSPFCWHIGWCHSLAGLICPDNEDRCQMHRSDFLCRSTQYWLNLRYFVVLCEPISVSPWHLRSAGRSRVFNTDKFPCLSKWVVQPKKVEIS